MGGWGRWRECSLGTELPFGMRTEFWRWMVGVEEVLQTKGAAGTEALRWEQQGAREGGGGAGTRKSPRAGLWPSLAPLHQVVEASGKT